MKMKKIQGVVLVSILSLFMAVAPVTTAFAKTTVVEQTEDGEKKVTYYTIRFQANKGKKVKKTLTLRKNDVYGKLPKTSREGYKFKGWYTKKSGGKKVTAKTVFKGKDDQVLYAHWKKIVTEQEETTPPASEGQIPEAPQPEAPQPEAPQPEQPETESALVTYSANAKIEYKQNNYNDFLVLKNFKPEYLYCRFDYDRFIGSSGKNVGCTATADAMLASIYMDKPFSPNDEGWISGVGATWTNSVIADGTKSYTVQQQCQAVYDFLYQGKPVLIRVVGHSVTAIGIRDGVAREALTPSDILIADPADAKIKLADEMGWRVMTDANGWGLRIPKESLSAN